MPGIQRPLLAIAYRRDPLLRYAQVKVLFFYFSISCYITIGNGRNTALPKEFGIMNLESLIELAKEHGASDLHLEPGLP
ncbi:MAG: hypothetical protein H6Q52_2557, partial [Deltaproteobacteria bacterium]|nr:hypothetical protein [Deltaproteobacteria bacterium]